MTPTAAATTIARRRSSPRLGAGLGCSGGMGAGGGLGASGSGIRKRGTLRGALGVIARGELPESVSAGG